MLPRTWNSTTHMAATMRTPVSAWTCCAARAAVLGGVCNITFSGMQFLCVIRAGFPRDFRCVRASRALFLDYRMAAYSRRHRRPRRPGERSCRDTFEGWEKTSISSPPAEIQTTAMS
ncbi:hypothetical protein D9M72_442250 [compost metagenome]